MPYFPARLDFPSPPLSAPGSPRMVPSSMKERAETYQMIISNDDGVFNFISLIKIKDYIVKTLTEILSIINVKVFRLFIYLIV